MSKERVEILCSILITNSMRFYYDLKRRLIIGKNWMMKRIKRNMETEEKKMIIYFFRKRFQDCNYYIIVNFGSQ